MSEAKEKDRVVAQIKARKHHSEMGVAATKITEKLIDMLFP